MRIPIEGIKSSLTVAGVPDLVPEEHLANEFVDLMRPQSAVFQMGARTLSNLVGHAHIPKKTGSASGYWFAADGSDAITPSDPAFSTISLTPRFLGGLVEISHKLITQSSPDIDQLISNDLLTTLSVELDRAASQGSGVAPEPRGVIGATGVTETSHGGTPNHGRA